MPNFNSLRPQEHEYTRKCHLALTVSRTAKWMVQIQKFLQLRWDFIVSNNCVSQLFAWNIKGRRSSFPDGRTDRRTLGEQWCIFFGKCAKNNQIWSRIEKVIAIVTNKRKSPKFSISNLHYFAQNLTFIALNFRLDMSKYA